MADQHDMRILLTGVDADGKSCVIGEERVLLGSDPSIPGFWFAEAYRTSSVPPPARPQGCAENLDVQVDPGLVRWQILDYAPLQTYAMHHTDTIDIDIVLRGNIELTLDDGAHPLEAGDGVVIAGVDHAWKSGPEGCRLSVTFIGTPPPTGGQAQ
jgi:quercetin dioxygenase-like cupin family protein